jgi:very-short-patch-repair endonuclease
MLQNAHRRRLSNRLCLVWDHAVVGYGRGVTLIPTWGWGGGQGSISQRDIQVNGGGQRSIRHTSSNNCGKPVIKNVDHKKITRRSSKRTISAMSEIFKREDTKKRREHRRSMSDAEVLPWFRLKGRQLLGCKFRRQYSVGSFVLDFFSAEIKLGIELDGHSHFQSGAHEYDQKRQQFIGSFGIKVVRILNTEIYQNLEGVLEMIGREVVVRRQTTDN